MIDDNELVVHYGSVMTIGEFRSSEQAKLDRFNKWKASGVQSGKLGLMRLVKATQHAVTNKHYEEMFKMTGFVVDGNSFRFSFGELGGWQYSKKIGGDIVAWGVIHKEGRSSPSATGRDEDVFQQESCCGEMSKEVLEYEKWWEAEKERRAIDSVSGPSNAPEKRRAL